jgi:hypothetical protein
MQLNYYKPESKHQSTERKHPMSPVENIFKSEPTAAKAVLMLFRDSQEPFRNSM